MLLSLLILNMIKAKYSVILFCRACDFCHRKLDIVAAATTATLATILKALYFGRWKTWMLHTLYMNASCYEVSVSHMSNVLDLIFMVQWLLEKKLIFCNVKLSNRITIFSRCIRCKVLMPVRQFPLDLDLISWISEQG